MTEHPNLAAALVAALAELTVVEQTRTAKIPTKTGGEYSYKYADIGDVVKVSRPILAGHGIVALTPVHAHGDGLACTVTFLHSSGDRLDLGPFPFPHGESAQATGSMVTYHRRYALVAALGIAASDDDDGASAAPRQRQKDEVPATVRPSSSGEKVELVRKLSEKGLSTAGDLETLRKRLADAEDGVAPPKEEDPQRPFEERVDALAKKAAEKTPADRKVMAAGGGE